MNCLSRARTAVLEALAPVSVPKPEPKKYFNSKVPCGVAMYLAVVTRLMVDSCKANSSAISRSTKGRMASSPCIKKLRWRSTMAVETRRMVSKRCWMFLMNQRASCKRCCMLALAASELPPRPWRKALAYTSCTRKRGMTSGLSTTLKPRPERVTNTSGTTTWRSRLTKRRPGLGSKRAIKPKAVRTSASSKPQAAHKRLTSRLAISSSGCSQINMAARASAVLRCSMICKRKHSPKSRAPTPAGSMWCTWFKAICKRC